VDFHRCQYVNTRQNREASLKIQVKGAKEHNLKNVDVSFGDGLTVVTGVSGSGKTSLVFDTLYHEARRRFQAVFSFGSPGSRLSPASVDSITGMGPAVAVGQNQLNRNPNSTLASASGLHPFIRLLYAHYGQRYCKNCGSRLSVLSEDEIVAKILQLSLQGPINVYAPLVRRAKGSHTTLLHYLSGDFGSQSILIDGQPWNTNKPDPTIPHDIEILTAHLDGQLSAGEARKSVQTVKALGANTVMLRGKSMEQSVSFAPECIGCGTWFLDLEPKHFRQSCPMCKGAGCVHCHTTGLHPEAAAVTWKDLTFNEIQHKSITEVHELFQNPDLPDTAHRLREEIARRLDTLTAVGLGYVTLDRPMPDLSRGESQRVRLAVVLTSRLEDILHVLDEPTIGQHPADVLNLLPVLKELAGPVVFVEHDRIAAAYAHRAIDIGPAAGNAGGQIIFNGTPSQLWKSDTPSGNYFSLRERVIVPVPRPPATKFLTIDGARKHNLRHIRVKIPMGRLTVVTGVSGSGKSTLVEDVLAASLAQKTPAGCDRISYPGNSRLKAVMVDQSPIGKNPRSTPATYTKLSDIIRDIYSKVTGYTSTHFSFNRPEGACPTCSGMGAVEIRMKYLPSTWITCTDCGGRRFKDQILEARITINNRLISIGDFYEFPVEEAVNLLENEEHHVQLAPKDYNNALNILNALRDIGLGYLPLGQPSPTLSGGEAQRVKLARYLSSKTLTGQVLLLDEPTTGLHPRDLNGLLEILNRLVNAGATIVVVEHNTDMIRAADWIIDLGPGAGPGGGEILFMGPPAKLPETKTSLTARALLEEDNLLPPESITEDLKPFEPSPVISIRGAKANNLKQVDVDFPKKKLTVVTGVSGSGKSSLVADVLEAEARRRFLETLSLYERQGQKEGPQAPADSVTGLGVCLTVTPDRKLYDRRSTVGTASEISHHLAVLFSFLGERTCLSCGAPMKRDNRTGKNSRWNCTGCGTRAPIASPGKFNPFNYAAACTTCQGIGSLQEPRPEKLIISPDKPLCRGAMYSPGFFPKGYLCKPGNGGYDVVQAFASRYAFDTVQTPWESIPGEVRRKFLFGDPEPLEVVFTNPGGKTTVSTVRFPGFYGWIRDWDMGGTYTDTVPCPACNGAKLRPPYLAVTLKDYNFHQLSILPLSRVLKILSGMGSPEDNLKSLDITLKRLIFLERVGLGYLDLNRVTATLSAGEAQRVKLAGLLGSGLTSLTVLLDEPTRGLHPCEVNALTGVLKELRDEGNTVLVVEHDLQLIREADHLIDVGPLAGTGGGTIVASGTPAEVAEQDTITGRWLRGKSGSDVRRNRRKPNKWLVIAGARENNLKGEPVEIPLGVLVGVCGVSGSGKSTLFIDTIGRALAPQKQTTSVAREPLQPGNHDRITGAPHRTLLVDQGKKGIQNPANFLEIQGPLDKQFFQCEDAKALGLDEADFKKRCTVCNGNGVNRQDMGFLPGIDTECETCDGTGRGPEVRDVILKGFTIKQLHRQTIEDVYRLFIDEEKIARPLKAAIDVGLGYLVLKQPGYSLSGGEAQRLKIAREMCRKTNGETLYILDEPTVGQHQEDVHRLCRVLHRLVDEGNSVVVVEHHPMLLASCDWVLELGPCGGPEGGNVIAAGTPEIVSGLPTPTAAYIGEILETPDESRKPGE
jgi:excinuclease ABC subunit A